MINCKVPGCDRPHRTIGYCAAHYAQDYQYGRIVKPILGEKILRGRYKKAP